MLYSGSPQLGSGDDDGVGPSQLRAASYENPHASERHVTSAVFGLNDILDTEKNPCEVRSVLTGMTTGGDPFHFLRGTGPSPGNWGNPSTGLRADEWMKCWSCLLELLYPSLLLCDIAHAAARFQGRYLHPPKGNLDLRPESPPPIEVGPSAPAPGCRRPTRSVGLLFNRVCPTKNVPVKLQPRRDAIKNMSLVLVSHRVQGWFRNERMLVACRVHE